MKHAKSQSSLTDSTSHSIHSKSGSHNASVITQQSLKKKPTSTKKLSIIKQVDVLEPTLEAGSYKQTIFGGSLYSKALLRGRGRL